jgi:Tol biopolymer transport system component
LSGSSGRGPVPISESVQTEEAAKRLPLPVSVPSTLVLGPRVAADQQAITPDKKPVRIPEIQVSYSTATPYRFVPNGKALIYLRPGNLPTAPAAGAPAQATESRWDFYWLNLETSESRRLTRLGPGFTVQSFDISADGRQIIFDRLRQNSDIVMMDLR